MVTMWQQRLEKWIRHPETLDGESLGELERLLEQYPYFQTARLLYLKNLYLLGSPSFEEELRKGALYVADVTVLFYFIEGSRFELKRHLPDKAEPGHEGGDRTLDLINRFLSDTEEREGDGLLPLPQEACVDYTSVLMEEDAEVDGTPSPLRGQELIDQFIGHAEADAEMGPAENVEADTEMPEEDRQPVEETGKEEDESYFTETLAKIYVKQQRYDKALEILKKLNLKYQKKNTYFADQIRFLEKLIINAKSK